VDLQLSVTRRRGATIVAVLSLRIRCRIDEHVIQISEAMMANQSDQVIRREIEGLFERARFTLDVDVENGHVRITGPVSSENDYQAALDLVRSVGDVRGIEDEIEIATLAPDSAFDDAAAGQGFEYAENPALDDEADVEFAGDLMEDVGAEASNVQEAVEEAEPYFPPTDPVVRPTDDEQELEITGGWQDTSMDEVAEDPELDSSEAPPTSSIEGQRDDETVREDILRELRQDALTTDLSVDVEVIRGVAVLKGTVSSVDDAINAEEVARRVPGVKDVREETILAQ
jgi:osmotically-inducible protein OsmY